MSSIPHFLPTTTLYFAGPFDGRITQYRKLVSLSPLPQSPLLLAEAKAGQKPEGSLRQGPRFAALGYSTKIDARRAADTGAKSA